MRQAIMLAVLVLGSVAHADLAAPLPANRQPCIDDELARFMPATVRTRAGVSEAVIVYRPDEWPVGPRQPLDVWLPSGKLGRFAVRRIKKLWKQDGWVVEAQIALPRVPDQVALVALPGDACPASREQNPPFPSAYDYKELGLEPVARPSHVFDLDGDGRPDAFTIEDAHGPHSLFLLDRARRVWVRSELTDVS